MPRIMVCCPGINGAAADVSTHREIAVLCNHRSDTLVLVSAHTVLFERPEHLGHQELLRVHVTSNDERVMPEELPFVPQRRAL